MKVLHIITGLNQGGAESALFRLVTYKKLPDVENIVVSMTGSGVYGNKLESKGIKVYTVDMPRGRMTFRGIVRLWKIIRLVSPDIVQTWMYHADLIGGIVSWVAGYKHISWGIVNFNLSPAITSISTRWTAKLCAVLSDCIPQKIVSCSARAVTAHQKIGYNRSKFVTIPLGCDVNEFRSYPESKAELTKSWGIAKNEIIIGCVARWDPQKDHKNLVEAMVIVRKNYPHLHCVLAGPGMDNQNGELVEMINNINAENSGITLAGVSTNIAAVMSAFDIHVLPSLGEAFPNVVVEAMACATPCVVTDVGDTKLIVGNTGWVVPPAQPIALATAIIEAAEETRDSQLWNKRKEDCRERIIQNFSMRRMIEDYEVLWKSMLKN